MYDVDSTPPQASDMVSPDLVNTLPDELEDVGDNNFPEFQNIILFSLWQ